MTQSYTIAVRQLVAFVCKTGHIQPGSGGTTDDMAVGSFIHRKLQAEAIDTDDGYEREVHLQADYAFDDCTLTVRGNADGVSRKDGTARIDEYKAIRCRPERLPESARVLHLAQARCYGHMLCETEGLQKVELCLVYCEVDSGEITRISHTETRESLAAYFVGLCEQYAVWLRWQNAHLAKRNASAAALSFPFGGFRPGQRALSAAVYRAVRDGEHLFAQAPTGIGKTLATLFPAIKAQGEGLGERIFYLTAKTVTRAAAMSALRQLEQGGLCYRAIQLTAKEKLCPCGLRCNPFDCKYANGYFDRVNGAVMEMLQNETLVSPDILQRYAEKHTLCPFELSLDYASWCDAIIGDYNHLFDPVARLHRFFEAEQTNHIVLVDEAHNLVERGRDCYSATLCRSAIDEAAKLLKEPYPGLRRMLMRISRPFRQIYKDMKTEDGDRMERIEQAERPTDLLEAAERFISAYTDRLGDEGFAPYREQTLQLYFDLRLLVQIGYECYDERYTTCWERYGRKDLRLRLFCMDPSRLLHRHYRKCRSVTLFSATLLPMEYYRSALCEEPLREIAVPSPFPPEHLCVMVHDGISLLYRDRERSYEPVAEAIIAAVEKPGNYFVFFPSFAYRDAVLERLQAGIDEAEWIVQEPGMEESERDAFLQQFEQHGDRPRIGLCVTGGIFAEGVDLVGERLSGVIVVGAGLPTVCFETERLRQYYEARFAKGYAYAYQYPGLNRVFQAAGRVIRTETDRGFVLLIDSRYLHPDYRVQFPAHWENCYRVQNPEEIRYLAERSRNF